MDNLGTVLLKLIEPPVSFLIVCFFSSSVIIFSPDRFIALLGLTTFRTNWLHWISLTWLYSTGCLLYAVIDTLRNVKKVYMERKQWESKIAGELKTLPEDERKMLILIAKSESDAVWVPYTHPAVMSLRSKHIIELVSNQLIIKSQWDFELCCLCRIHPKVLEIITSLFEDAGD
ncbi:MAG: super-infection exclusion protein B [Pyramidobacter porci]|uniref:super-infection exclusion protein B n=1 Tax=Pyramidobacter porci TaxID=2605789 RepID=UPI002A75D732|nr:super-infection exclusion protein B [Pyramidobacter porci]MDY2648912.1 super-infection exclusion protein B [Pyramidobacter porci]